MGSPGSRGRRWGAVKDRDLGTGRVNTSRSSGALSFSVSLSDVFAPSGGRMTSQKAVEKVALW